MQLGKISVLNMEVSSFERSRLAKCVTCTIIAFTCVEREQVEISKRLHVE